MNDKEEYKLKLDTLIQLLDLPQNTFDYTKQMIDREKEDMKDEGTSVDKGIRS